MSILNDSEHLIKHYVEEKLKITDIINNLDIHIRDIIGSKNECIIIEKNNEHNLGLIFTNELLYNVSKNTNKITLYNLIYPVLVQSMS